jgi:hypothetical protein
VYRSAVARNGSSPGATCESCGQSDGPFEPVHRVYLEAGDDGRLRPGQTVEEVERWCPACRAVYPNEPSPG